MNLPEKEVLALIKDGNAKQACIILMETIVLLNQEVEKLKQDVQKYEDIINENLNKKAGSGQGTFSIG